MENGKWRMDNFPHGGRGRRGAAPASEIFVESVKIRVIRCPQRNSVAVYQLLKSSKENFMPTPLNLGKVKPVKMPMLTARVVQP